MVPSLHPPAGGHPPFPASVLPSFVPSIARLICEGPWCASFPASFLHPSIILARLGLQLGNTLLSIVALHIVGDSMPIKF